MTRRSTHRTGVTRALAALVAAGRQRGIAVVGDTAEVLGSARAAIYDGVQRDGRWYYWLGPREKLDLRSRSAIRR